MSNIGAFEAKNTFEALLDLVQKGEDVVITRHGKPVARLIPERQAGNRQPAREAVARIRARKLARTSPLPLVDNWLAFRNEGLT
ncbi:type II toxin-antitoxin system Phd/YefM family antitoxin [Rhabdaerophilum calidifontis]|uniref:type II toxin-antitoxin system Phd/YefM family antitoxin n=1 Tax=Rhabdaerophilum calidifontis TaxID=2604328 RepID=UPI0012397199|nr:type II toxin-antitoxin system prevent-host-death family antitoxin [Rhabdaerophilum calidifontis]